MSGAYNTDDVLDQLNIKKIGFIEVPNEPSLHNALLEEANEDKLFPVHPLWCSKRLVVAVIGFFGFINFSALRATMSVAMVCMVNHTVLAPIDFINVTTPLDLEAFDASDFENVSTIAFNQHGEFNWPKSLQGIILGSYYLGYILTQLPGAWLSHKWGSKKVIGWSMFLGAIGTLLSPLGARIHYWVLIFLRFVTGLSSGVFIPSSLHVWSTWAPSTEKSQLISINFSGIHVGVVATLPLAGVLCKFAPDGGWPFIFYVSGVFGLVWFVLWMTLYYDSPALHPTVSSDEQEYIERSLRHQVSGTSNKIPWLRLFSSRPVWATYLSHMCVAWAMILLLTNMPTYVHEVLRIGITGNGIVSALPFLGYWIVSAATGPIADKLIVRGVSRTIVRKLYVSLGSFIPAASLLGLAFVGEKQVVMGALLLFIAVAGTGFQTSGGFIVNYTDLAPAHAGMLIGVGNTLSAITGLSAPALAGYLTQNKLHSEWQLVLCLAAAIYAASGVVFNLFGSGKIQSWAQLKPTKKDRMASST